MKQQILAAALLTAALGADAVFAQQSSEPAKQQPANEQVIVPQVDRRDIKLPRYPSKDFAVGVLLGAYNAQNFGSSGVAGLRLGYHITEDIFVEAVYAQTKVSDESFRQVLPGGIFAQPKETLKYYNLSAGYNLLPGEIFIGRNIAKASAVYLIGGIGSTNFVDSTKVNRRSRQTVNFGLGMRVLLTDRTAVQVDMRDHVFSNDILGRRETTQNLELTTGFTFYF
jgi:outer membrane beta-barrel protein